MASAWAQTYIDRAQGYYHKRYPWGSKSWAKNTEEGRKYTAYQNERNKIVSDYQKAMDTANAANEARYQEGLANHDKIIGMYEPGGAYGEGAMASYQRGKAKAISTGYQNLVSSGMSNLTTTGGLEKKYEEEVGNLFRLNLNDRKTSAYASAIANKNQWIYNKEEQQPNMNLMSQLLNQAASAYGQ